MSRFAFTEPSIGSTTTMPPSARAEHALAELLRDEDEALAARLSRATTASSAAWSIAVVSSPPSPRLRIGSRSARVGRRSRTCSMSATQRAAELEPGAHPSTGWKRRPESGFGKKYVLFERHELAASRDGEDVFDTWLAQEERGVRLARVDCRDRLVRARRVRRFRRGRAGRRARRRARLRCRARSRRRVPVRDRDRAVVRLLGQARERLLDAPRPARPRRRLARSGRPEKTRCVGNTCSPGSAGRDEERHDRASRPAPSSAPKASARLVAMVAVRDEELRVAEERARVPSGSRQSRVPSTSTLGRPSPGARHSSGPSTSRKSGSGWTRVSRSSCSRSSVDPPDASARAEGRCPSRRARPRATRRAPPLARDAVGPDVLLGDEPGARLGVALEDPSESQSR